MFDIMTMAENIKTYRNKRGLNQYEFAEKLGISPQAVSKWECGQSCPSIENLCVISEILDVSIDTLIGENSDSEKMMIGIDGGGTKTEFVLFSESGRILKRIVLDGCNPNTVGMEEAMNILQLGIDTLMKIKGKISGIFVGAAGLDSGNNTSKIKKMLKEKYPKALVLAHPECKQEVLDLADYIGSTSGIINYATESDNEEFIICTESGVGYELRTKNPNKKFYFAGTKHFCPNMKLNTVEKVCHVLKTGENEVHVSDETRLKSLVPLDKMLEMAK